MCYDLVLIAVNYEQSKCNVRARVATNDEIPISDN